MKNRLMKSLIVAATAMSCVSAFATAPVLRELPSINIGDLEDNIGTDNNYFVYTNAFKFDRFVKESDTTVSDLIWSFDESSFPGENPDIQWFMINAKDLVLLGDVAIAADALTSYSAHINPSGKNIRQGAEYATFRDVVFSPGWGPLTHPFPPPTDPDKTRHAIGKVVYFYVSNGHAGGVARTATVVKSTDNTSDSQSGGYQYDVGIENKFSDGPEGWVWVPGYGAVGAWSDTLGALTVTVSPETNKFRSGSWQANYDNWLPYTDIGVDNVVRAKYYMFATNQIPSGQKNLIPNLRLRLQNRYAVNSMLEIYHNTNNPAVDATSAEFAPSQDPSKPSLYRVDLDQVDVPVLSNGTEGVMRAFDLYGDYPQFMGTIALTESVIGTYPKSQIAETLVAPSKTYNASDLLTYFPNDNQTLLYIPGAALGDFPTSDTAAPPSQLPTIVESAINGVTMDCANVPTNRVGAPVRDFNPPQDYTDIPSLIRVEENKQYVVRWHLTSTQDTNKQSQIRMRARSIGWTWAQKLEIGGSYPTNLPVTQQIAQQTLPGVGCMNPEQMVPGENGGWYNLIMQTPLSMDIRPDVSGSTIADKMPLVSALPGPGSATYAAGKDRAIRLGIDILDTISGGSLKDLEKGNVRVDKIELRVYNLVLDE